MKIKFLVYLFSLFLAILNINYLNAQEKTIFVWGGDINLKFTQYIVNLTQKENPRLCYLPTASGDNADNIKLWEKICTQLRIDTLVFKVWVSSSENNKSFEDILMHSDAIVVGGGNTLNMLGIWKAQGIDHILKKALDKGIILAGGSAGAICWFINGISDSRPVKLSCVDGLNLLPYSTCPHYDQNERKELYHQMIKEQKMHSGYALDEKAGILFKNGKAVDFVSQSDKHNSFYICVQNGEVKSEKVKSRILLQNNALPENSYKSSSINKRISEISEYKEQTPLEAYASEIKTIYQNKTQVPDIKIEKTFTYNDQIAGIVNDTYLNSMGLYSLWYFYNHKGTWTSMGEDIGGETLLECEITFREKAQTIIKRAKEKFNMSN